MLTPGLPKSGANKGTEEEEMMSLKLLITACLLKFGGGRAGYAPMEAPKLPAGFCPRETGSITETTGGEEFLSISFRNHLLCCVRTPSFSI